MYSKRFTLPQLDDIIALIGLVCFLAGIYLWLGLPATLILLGGSLIFVGVRMDIKAGKT